MPDTNAKGDGVDDQGSRIAAEVREHKDGEGRTQYFVYFETPAFVGSRGVGLGLAEAEALAERIRKDGPDA
jgi:hypothetical protein